MKSNALRGVLKMIICIIVAFIAIVALTTAIMFFNTIGNTAHASQDAPNDLYAMQCIDGTCYYATGKPIPKAVLEKFEKQMAVEMAKISQEQGEESEETHQ